MRFLIATAVLLGLALTAHAHFVFVHVDEAEVRLVFGHKAEPDPAAFPTRAEKTTLTARDAAGKESKLMAEKGTATSSGPSCPPARRRSCSGRPRPG